MDWARLVDVAMDILTAAKDAAPDILASKTKTRADFKRLVEDIQKRNAKPASSTQAAKDARERVRTGHASRRT